MSKADAITIGGNALAIQNLCFQWVIGTACLFFAVFSRWVLANSGNAKEQARLAALLKLPEPTDYFYAAYALRFFRKITPQSYAALEACASRLAPDAPHRVYVLSALYVHTALQKRDAIRKKLLKYVRGEKSERFEVA